MTKTLIIARHGNTFTSDQTPTRVGKHTDLPLVPRGIEQAVALGQSLQQQAYKPECVYVSSLMRTQQTAQHALREMDVQIDLQVSDIFDEIDYGPDENQPEENVINRIGKEAIKAWDDHAVPPEGWHVNPSKMIENWQKFADDFMKTGDLHTALVVTSNGTARFAPHIAGDYEDFKQKFPLKLSTGAYGVLVFDHGKWQIKGWNIRPNMPI